MTRDLLDIAADIGQLEVQIKWAGRKLERALSWRGSRETTEVAGEWFAEALSELSAAQTLISQIIIELEGERDGNSVSAVASRTGSA